MISSLSIGATYFRGILGDEDLVAEHVEPAIALHVAPIPVAEVGAGLHDLGDHG